MTAPPERPFKFEKADIQVSLKKGEFQFHLKGPSLDFKLKAPDFKFRKPHFKLDDDARFVLTWLNSPLKTGSVTPSGKALANAMALAVDPAISGDIIELGPGTGPVTEALIARGIAEERLILVEYDKDFCELLRARFPKARVIEGDAYAITKTLEGHLNGPAAAVVSSLPLVTRPDDECITLLREAFALLGSGAPFVQFTYGLVSPVPTKTGGFTAKASKRVWKNLPPAQVWTYRALDTAAP